jgi:hypothetical protein
MKNFIIALALILTGTTFASASCVDGVCSRGPVRRAGSVVLDTTKQIVTAPVRAVKKVNMNRTYRRNHR